MQKEKGLNFVSNKPSVKRSLWLVMQHLYSHAPSVVTHVSHRQNTDKQNKTAAVYK